MELLRDTPWGRFKFAVHAKRGQVRRLGDGTTCSPRLPNDMRIDQCVLHRLEARCLNEDVLDVELYLLPEDRFEIDQNSGEALDAFDLTGPSGTGSAATRNPDWMVDRHAIAFRRVNSGKGTLCASYDVRSAKVITVEAAWAWTSLPATDQEGLSPWFAVDKVMQF